MMQTIHVLNSARKYPEMKKGEEQVTRRWVFTSNSLRWPFHILCTLKLAELLPQRPLVD